MDSRELSILEDEPGERLVLGLPGRPPLRERLRGWGRDLGDTLRQGLAGVFDSPKSFLGALGAILVLLLCGALLVFAGYLILIALGLILVLYEIGVWLVAWWLVWAVAKYAVFGRPRAPHRPLALRHLSFRRDRQELRWETALGSRIVPFSELEGLQFRIETTPGKSSKLALEIRARGERTTHGFSVAQLDREEEGADLCFRVARVLRWPSYSAEHDRLQGLEIHLSPRQGEETSHPFRAHAAEQGWRPIPAREHSTEDWSVALAAGFQEPTVPLPPLTVPRRKADPFKIQEWAPGTLVQFAAKPRFRPARVLLGQLLAVLAGGLIVAGVVGLWLVVGGVFGPQPGGHKKTPGDVFAWLATASCVLGWLGTFQLWLRRAGRTEASFRWEEKLLSVSDDEETIRVPFEKIERIELHEVGASEHRYLIEVQTADEGTLRVYESPLVSGGDGHLPALTMTVELARSLGRPWRCVAAPPA